MDLPIIEVDYLTALAVSAALPDDTIIIASEFPGGHKTRNGEMGYARIDCWRKFGWFQWSSSNHADALFSFYAPGSDPDFAERDCLCNGNVHRILSKEESLEDL